MNTDLSVFDKYDPVNKDRLTAKELSVKLATAIRMRRQFARIRMILGQFDAGKISEKKLTLALTCLERLNDSRDA